MLLGSMTGAIGGGLQSGQFGRRWSLLIDTLIFIIATIAITLAPNLMVVLISRFVQGHCVASSAVAMPIYTSEISQPEIRKITGVFAIICISFGGFLSMIFGNFCIIHFLKPYLNLYKLFFLILGALFQWRLAVGLTCIPPFICFFILILMAPESPAWLMSKGRDNEAIEALKILRGKDNLEVINNEFKSINKNMMQAKQNMNKTNNAGSFSNLLEMINNQAFLKPFGVLLLLFPFALNWTGTAAVQFYFVSILRYDYFII